MSMNRSVFDEDECAAAVACRRTRLRTLKSEFPETTVIVFFPSIALIRVVIPA